ncbi:MAG: DUF4465 domain-containing protein, partial [Bacteroidota bacterium]
MKKYALFMAAAFTLVGATHAQFISEGFEEVTLDSGNVINGSKGEKEFKFRTVLNAYGPKMPIQYDTSWGGYWSGGWAISKQIDGSTGPSDFMKHLYCAKPAFGAERNANGKFIGKAFAVGMNGTYLLQNGTVCEGILSIDVANSTYAYNSMKNGDNFAKKFGGSTGNDADSFVLNIKFFVDTQFVNSKRVVLADFRFADNAKDYILDSWQTVNLPTYFPEGFVDSISFELESSDNGQFGMNTPGFFCVDNIVYGHWLSAKKLNTLQAKVFPNPAKDVVEIQTQHPAKTIEVIDVAGRTMLFQPCDGSSNTLNVSRFALGT